MKGEWEQVPGNVLLYEPTREIPSLFDFSLAIDLDILTDRKKTQKLKGLGLDFTSVVAEILFLTCTASQFFFIVWSSSNHDLNWKTQ